MTRYHGSTSAREKCFFCGKVTSGYISFYEGIEIKVGCCREHENDVRKFDKIMEAHLRLIKTELRASHIYGEEDEKCL
jgi:hypothetical protein